MTNKDKIFTTLKQIHDHSPCKDDYKKLCTYLGGVKNYGKNTPVTFKQIYDSHGYFYTLWCLRAVDEKWHPLWRHFACDCADDVLHLITDQRARNLIDITRGHADGLVTDQELYEAKCAAWDDDLASAMVAARNAAGATAWSTAWSAALDAAHVAANAAGWAAASAAARGPARDAARDAARSTAMEKQMQRLFEYCRTGERVK